MKTNDQIHQDIIERFESKVQDSVQADSAIDLYTAALSKEYEALYEEIENNKTPHVWTKLEGEYLDMAGAGVDCPRREGESDATYKYRFMHWLASMEKSNLSAIEMALLNLEYASYARFVPLTRGAGTGTCYIIPQHYTQENISASIQEVYERLEEVIDPGMYVEYIIPTVIGVRLQINMEASDADVSLLRSNLETKIMNYINELAPNSYLELGEINKIGINEPNVTYFNVMGLFLNDMVTTQTSVFQRIDMKMLYDEIIWLGDE